MDKLLKKSNQDLLTAAACVQKKAYAPYSSFQVGAALLAEDGCIYSGCNVENAAYPLGQCAEAGAIADMVKAGNRKIKKIMIMSPTDESCPPCGGCRQKIQEFSDPDTEILMADQTGNVSSITMSELLPFAFELDK